ncbi:hypothetical protein [Candidatus Poriferisocius sp.]|uniref:hypothetical protein n=1 Tax=Candidatus Poriferisocius sp. TaxID=3101276 RepID=UPI003B5AE36A
MNRPLDVLGAPGWGEVDARGLVRPGTGAWTLDWWIRASDRWHRASQEAAVRRQDAAGGGAVVETRMKVPDGDAVQRVWAVAVGGGPAAAVVEVGNEAATAFAAALVLDAPGAVVSVGRGGVTVGRRPVLAWDRPPAMVAVGPDAPDTVLSVETVSSTGASGWEGEGRDRAALVWAVPHTARLAVSAALGAGAVPAPADLPDADAVERGWRAHLDRGARIEVPDEGLARRVDGNRRRWLGRTGRTEVLDVAELAELAVRLDHHGYHDDAEVALDEVAARLTTEAPVERLLAFAVHHELTGDTAAAARHTEAVAEALGAAIRIGAPVPVEAIERLLVAAGQDRAAADLRRLDLPRAEPPAQGLRAELVADDGDHLKLVPGFRPGWRGGPLAVYGLPTRFGPLSYAVRWHGARPALLWELEARPSLAPVAISAPALDEDWSSHHTTGEALLAPS